MKKKATFKKFANIGYLSVHEWPIYWYQPQKRHICRSLVINHCYEGRM